MRPIFWGLIVCSMACAAFADSKQPARDAHAQHERHDHDHDHDHDQRAPIPAESATSHVCRSGAFLEAAAILNSTMEISDVLTPEVAARSKASLDVLLFTALKQAHDEVHCVAGTFKKGYGRSFTEIIERAVVLAKVRGLSADAIGFGERTLERLREPNPKL
jgi:hypothetical protein